MADTSDNSSDLSGSSSFGTGSGLSIAAWTYGLAALLIILSASSLFLLAHFAWREADKRALEHEQTRFRTAMAEVQRQIAHDQLDLSYWDDTFQALKKPYDKEFIEDKLAEYLWEDFDLNRSFVVDEKGTLLLEAHENDVVYGPKPLAPDNLLVRIADRTRTAWQERKNQSGSIIADWYMPLSALVDISQSTLAVVDGTPALLSAVPILPDYGQGKEGPGAPDILINAVYLDDSWLASLANQLAFKDLKFFEGAPDSPHPTKLVINGWDGSAMGYFIWDHAKPGRDIWKMALPLILLMAAIIGTVAFFAATKIGRLSSSLERSERQNRHLARHDLLTGLPNRHHFSVSLKEAINGLPDRHFTVFACDLDKFKEVNDTYGHEAGDVVLKVAAERMNKVVGQQGLVSRFGGDEFFVLVDGDLSHEDIGAMAAKLCRVLSDPIGIGAGINVQIGISMGIAHAITSGETETEIIRSADLALYRAKEDGRNAFRFADGLQSTATPDQKTTDIVPLRALH